MIGIGEQSRFVIVFLFINLLIVLWNTWGIPRLERYHSSSRWPFVSILVPARNEEDGIDACVRSLLEQDYPSFEVLVLDDHSTDRTPEILQRLKGEYPRLQVLQGTPLPSGWLGKHWACHQLAQHARGELLLFTDADTYHRPEALRHAVAALESLQVDVLSVFPHQEALTWGERLIIPFISFGIYTFLPVALGYHLRWPPLTVTIGQFMLFRRRVYEAIGGYEAVRNEVIDDVSLGRRAVSRGYHVRLFDGRCSVTCRMYSGFWEAVDGFSKNIFAFFGYHAVLYLLAWYLIALLFIWPPLVVVGYALGNPVTHFPLSHALLAMAEGLILWGMAYHRFRLPLWMAALYPLNTLVFVLIGLRSLVWSLTGHAIWKDRAFVPPLRW
ncbi:MAG: glycosyltransferase [Anaerolineales bacterium]